MTEHHKTAGSTRRTLIKAAVGLGVVGAGVSTGILGSIREAAATTHPGLLHTSSDLTRMATQVGAGAQPWTAGWGKLTANAHAANTWTPTPLATVYRGTGTAENYGTLYNDIAAAYQNALRYRVTGITAYGTAAMNILNAWSATLTTITGTSDKYLAAGLYGYQLANSAELIRDFSGFKLSQFQTMMRNVFYPMNNDFLVNHNGALVTHYWANWDLCNIASMLAIGILCDDQAKIDQAVAYFRTGAGNGSISNAIPYVYPAQGLAQFQESGRDQGHATLGIGLLGTICEMAWNQGIDLYGLDDNRILKCAEYVARYNLGEEVPYTAYTWQYGTAASPGTQVQSVISETGRGTIRPIWELVYNHYAVRRGLAAPNVAAFARVVRPEGGGGDYGPNSGGYDQLGFGTLTATRVATATLPTTTRSFQSVNYPTRWICHRDGLAYLDPVDVSNGTATKQGATFTVVPGLADSAGYSFKTTTGEYLRHASYRLRVAADDGTTGFDADATFYPVPGSASGSVRLMSYNYPGRCIRHRSYELWLDPCAEPAEDAGFQADSSFNPLNAWYQ